MTTPDRIVVATRGSRLALRQAEIVAEGLQSRYPKLVVELLTVNTKGDTDQRPFASIGGKALFVTEVERAVLEGRADVAVHSAKDLTAELTDGCTLVCIPERARAEDVVVGGRGDSGEERIGSLPAGARVGTSSMRRRALLVEARPELAAVELRGNLDTRIAKVKDGRVDAALLAAAGLDRLDWLDVDAAVLDPEWWVPAPAQGALAVEARSDRSDLAELFASLSDPATTAEVMCERAFSARLEGGCSVPLGCLARARGDELVVTGYLGDPSGGRGLRDRISGPVAAAEQMGRELAEALLSCGGDDILADIRDAEPTQISPP